MTKKKNTEINLRERWQSKNKLSLKSSLIILSLFPIGFIIFILPKWIIMFYALLLTVQYFYKKNYFDENNSNEEKLGTIIFIIAIFTIPLIAELIFTGRITFNYFPSEYLLD